MRFVRSLSAASLAWRWAAALASVSAAVVLGAWLWLRLPGDVTSPPTFADVSQLADGSTATLLEPTAEIEVRTDSERVVELRLTRGKVRFEVTRQAHRAFIVRAGHVSVRVLGTQFVVDRTPSGVRVAVERGSVEVSADTEVVVLGDGESKWFSVPREPERSSSLDSPQHEAERSSSLDSPQHEAEASTPPSLDAGSLPEAKRAAKPVDGALPRFLAFSRAGQHAQAHAVVETSPQILRTAEHLMTAADSARLSGHPSHAATFLRRLLEQYPNDSRAPYAAFTLGRIQLAQLGQPAAAAQSFALCRRLSPNGALADDALSREVEARYRSGDTARARRLGQLYLDRHPNGKGVETVRRLMSK